MVDGQANTAGEQTTEPVSAESFFADVAQRLGPPYRTSCDEAVLWLTPYDEAQHQRHAAHAHHALHRLAELGLAHNGSERIAAILLRDKEDQLAYHDLFAHPDDPPETTIFDGGCWRSYPVGHLAIPVVTWDALDAAFAHELVHAILSPEGLPSWFQEGVATEVETRMGNRSDPLTDEHAWQECLTWWREHDPTTFWDSSAFRDPASSKHEYRLAQVITMRWTRRAGALSAARGVGKQAWRNPDAALHGLCGGDRARLLNAVLQPPRPRGWFERALFAVFVGDRR